jgi:putative ABC transport system substrate-binding protein
VTAIVALGAAPFTVTAQPVAKVHRIGFLGSAAAEGYILMVDSLRSGLRDLGYMEGTNILIEHR